MMGTSSTAVYGSGSPFPSDFPSGRVSGRGPAGDADDGDAEGEVEVAEQPGLEGVETDQQPIQWTRQSEEVVLRR
jgi:hypothetical protein